MHSKRSNLRCPRAFGWRFVYHLTLIAVACIAQPDYVLTPASAAPALEIPALRVLKLRHHEANHPHRDTSGEFRLLSRFARQNGLNLQWIDGIQPSELVARLQRGEGDIVIADVLPDPGDAGKLLSSLSMGPFTYAVYGRRDVHALTPHDLAGLRIGINLSSPMWPYLHALQRKLEAVQVVVLPDNTDREALLQGIDDDTYDAVVVTARVNEDPAATMPQLKRLFELSTDNNSLWHFRPSQAGLRDQLNSFLQRYAAASAVPHAAFGDLDDIKRRRVIRVITRIDPKNYFLKRGRPAGFEYELVRSFANHNGLAVEFLVAENDSQVLQWLRDGFGDIVATRVNTAAVAAHPDLHQSVNYFHSADVIVSRYGNPRLDTTALTGKRVAVLANSIQHRQLSGLVSAGITLEPVILAPDTSPESLARLLKLADADAAIVDAHALTTLRSVDPHVYAGASLSSEFNYAWTLRSGDTELAATVDDFLRSNYRKETYNVLARRYFGRPHFVRFTSMRELSPYDDLVRRHAESFDFDWRLIVAQMYQESRFDPAALSSAGAGGLMQLLPNTARSVGVDDAFDPESGIRGGVAYLNRLRQRFDNDISPRERTWFALGAYNKRSFMCAESVRFTTRTAALTTVLRRVCRHSLNVRQFRRRRPAQFRALSVFGRA